MYITCVLYILYAIYTHIIIQVCLVDTVKNHFALQFPFINNVQMIKKINDKNCFARTSTQKNQTKPNACARFIVCEFHTDITFRISARTYTFSNICSQ